MFPRYINIKELVQKKSLFLLGPRQTGKSTLLIHGLKEAFFINLLESDTYREYSTYPERLREKLPFTKGIVVIDEIQRVPQLLNEVHLLIEKHKQLRFILTGSNARRLKHDSVNLLAGRAWPISFHPLISQELQPTTQADWLRYLQRGGIPTIYLSKFLEKDISSYIGTYLQEEIKAEGLVRSTERFSRFLDVAGFCNGEILNFTKISNDCGVPSRTVQEYFKILEDTLLGYRLDPLSTLKRKNVSTAKFYFFDLGIANFLLVRKEFDENSENFGRVLEHLIYLELRAYLDYTLNSSKLSFWRTHSGQEVNFVISKDIAIEVKATKNVSSRDCVNLNLLAEEFPKIKKIIVSREKTPRKTDKNIEIIHYQDFLKNLWKGKYL